MKNFFNCASSIVAATFLFGSAGSHARDLTVVGFGGALQDAFRTSYFQPYGKARNAKLVEDSYGGGIAKQKAMVEAGNVTWDVVQMDENEMISACEQGVLEQLDRKLVPNLKDIDNSSINTCGVVAFVWSEVLTYDQKKFGPNGPKTWTEFWDIKKWPGKRGLRKQPRMTLELALLADGVAPADIYKVLSTKAGQDRAFSKLDQIKPSIQWWESGAQPLEWLASGAVSATAAYNGRIAAANTAGGNFPIVWTGQLYSMDYWTIIKGTPNRKEAYDFLNFALASENQKAFSQAIPYGIPNKRTLASLTPQALSVLPTAPMNMQKAVLLDTKFWLDHEEELLARFTSWVAQ